MIPKNPAHNQANPSTPDDLARGWRLHIAKYPGPRCPCEQDAVGKLASLAGSVTPTVWIARVPVESVDPPRVNKRWASVEVTTCDLCRRSWIEKGSYRGQKP